MILKILNFIVVLMALITFISITWKFIKENRKHRKHMERLNEWSKFHEQLMNWSKEIVDLEVRVNFINQCAHELMHFANDKFRNGSLDDWDIEEEKQKVCKEWGQHIPSLLQEMRDKKLKQIL